MPYEGLREHPDFGALMGYPLGHPRRFKKSGPFIMKGGPRQSNDLNITLDQLKSWSVQLYLRQRTFHVYDYFLVFNGFKNKNVASWRVGAHFMRQYLLIVEISEFYPHSRINPARNCYYITVCRTPNERRIYFLQFFALNTRLRC